jgi:NhaP-type Na+/H+ or K+/H+ antiporter
MTNEQRTAVQGAVAALLAVAAAFGFITADETQTYGVSAVAVIGAVSSVVTAAKTWQQREAKEQQSEEEGNQASE